MNYLQQSLQHAEKIEQMLIESGGEITPEIQAEMSVNPKTITELVDTKYLSIERLDSSISFFEKKENEFKAIRLSLENAKKFINESIKQYMIDNDKSELVGTEYVFKLSSGKPKVNVVNEDKIPDVYKKQKTETTVDKVQIFEDLKKGLPVDGCILEESYTLRKSIKKG